MSAQLTHERFLTKDHSCKIFFWYLPNWTSTNHVSCAKVHTTNWQIFFYLLKFLMLTIKVNCVSLLREESNSESLSQINWQITPNFCSLLRKAELYVNKGWKRLNYYLLTTLLSIPFNKLPWSESSMANCAKMHLSTKSWTLSFGHCFKILFRIWNFWIILGDGTRNFDSNSDCK